MEFRFNRQCDGDRRRIAVDQDRPKFGFKTVEGREVAIVETGNTADIVKREAGAEFNLHVLGRRILVFEYGLAHAVMPATLAKAGFRVRLERLFTFDAGRRSQGKTAENVFGLHFVKATGVLRLSGEWRNQNRHAQGCEKTAPSPSCTTRMTKHRNACVCYR